MLSIAVFAMSNVIRSEQTIFINDFLIPGFSVGLLYILIMLAIFFFGLFSNIVDYLFCLFTKSVMDNIQIILVKSVFIS